jgi:O-antigen/teichoic acid export membrane protein
MSAHRVTRGFAWNHLYKIVEYGGISLYSILVVRKFGPEIGGNYAVYLSICGTLAMLTAFAVDGVLLRYLPRIARGESQIGDVKIEGVRPFLLQLLAFRLLVTAVVSSLAIIAFGIVPIWLPSFGASLGTIGKLWPYIAIYLFGQATVAFGTFTMIGLLQVRWVFFASLATRCAVLGLGLVLILSSSLTLERAVALSAIAAICNGALLLYWVHRHVYRESSPGIRKEASIFIAHIKRFVGKPGYVRVFAVLPFMMYGITTWGSDILGTVLGRQPDILMLRAILGENARDIGLYESAARLVLTTEYIFLLGLGGTLISVFSELVHQDESVHSGSVRYPRLLAARKDIAGFQAVSTAPLFAFMLVFAPLVMNAVYGYRFAQATPIATVGLAILSVTVVVFGGGMQITSLVVIGKERAVFKNRLAWGIFNLVVNYFLIWHYGGLGAMIGTQSSNAGACLVESMLARKWIGSSFSVLHTVRILAIVMVAVFVAYGGVALLPQSIPSLLEAIIAGLIMAIVTAGGYILFKVPEARKVFDRLRALARPEVLQPAVHSEG